MSVAVYFDLDHTLVAFDRDFESILTGTFEESFGRVEDEWIDAFGEYFWNYFRAFDPEPYRRAVSDLCEAEGLDATPESVAERLIADELEATVVRQPVRETLELLGDRPDRAVGVLTNGVGSVQREKLRRHDLLERLDAVVVSYEVGAHKPDPEIFERARDRIDADRYAMVGDDYEGDVAPAQELGFDGIHVDDGAEADVRVGAVDDLLETARTFAPRDDRH